MVLFGQIHRILAPVPNIMVALHARAREGGANITYSNFLQSIMRLFQSEERVEEGEELAWRGVLWHGVPHAGMEAGGGVRRRINSINFS